MNTIIVNITGGIGNQMFQYAFSKWIESNYNMEIKFDIRFYNKPHNTQEINKRVLVLENAFLINLEIAERNELDAVVPTSLRGKIYKKIKQYILGKKLIYLNDNKMKSHIIKPGFDILYANGYWGSLNYLYNLDLNELFQFKNVPIKVENLIEGFQNKTLISVHIRRGDYLNHDFLKLLDNSYYKDALSIFKMKNSHFFVFGDDPLYLSSWEQINNLDYTIVSGKGLKDYEELYIMTQCNHNIIANSTFSWWGAMLNKNNDKIVIYPKNWYNDPVYEKKIPKVIPKEWIRL